MKTLIMIFCGLFLYSCSLNHFSKAKRQPSSILEAYDGRTVRMSSEIFAPDIDETGFGDFIVAAQKKGIERIEIMPEEDPFKKASMTEQTSVTGDVYLLIGTNFEKVDEIIRKGDYDSFYATAKRLSELRFRVTMNLVASVEDLKNALSNKRPTIIIWTSHGNEEVFYDFNLVKVPYNIFKNASPSVYQFVLTSCHGFQAIQSGYKNYMPKTMKQFSWDRLVYHPTDVKKFLEDPNAWNPFTNYPGNFTYKNLTCRKDRDLYRIYHVTKKQYIGSEGTPQLEDCIQFVANSNDSFVCNKAGPYWEVFSKITLKQQQGAEGFDTSRDCISRVHNTYQGKTCRKVGQIYKFYDAHSDKPAEDIFATRDRCFDYIQNVKDI